MTVLVTGASGDIGFAVAKKFLDESHEVALVYNSSQDRVKLLEKENPARAAAFKCDVRSHEQVKSLFDSVKRIFGTVDVLVNCAGADKISCFQLLSDDEVDNIIDTNLKGTYYCCEEAFSHMNEKKSGAIVNISSIWGLKGASCEAAYSASKAGIIGLTQALADELAPSGIRVNCVAPGVINAGMCRDLDESTMQELKNMTPVGRLGTPEDVAGAVYFLSCEDASFITGQTLSVSGGF